jgi:hypothetical protein
VKCGYEQMIKDAHMTKFKVQSGLEIMWQEAFTVNLKYYVD